ncbi:MAG TPA: radical SAM protein [Spirochaetota bacterium]|nr:radical SAM protein [Spirochaetota bacterium]
MAGTRTTATQADEAQITRPEAVPPDLLAWADEYFARIKPWIFIREEDDLLIKRPNQAVKVTKTGARALSLLTSGMPVRTLLASLGSRERIAEMTAFLVNIRQHLEGTLLPCQELATIHEPLAINFTHLPILSELAIADGCNLACRFCYAGCAGTTARIARKQLARRQYMRIIEIIARDARVPSISFTGGEPTTNPALPALVRHAKQFDMRVNLITNGTLITPALARELAAAGLDSAQVSIEGPDAATHEALTTITGSFAASVAGLAALREAGILAHMHTTLTAANAPVAHEMPAFARSLGLARLSMNMLIPTGDARPRPISQFAIHKSDQSSSGSSRPPGPPVSNFSGTRRLPCASSTRSHTAWATRAARPVTACSPSRPTGGWHPAHPGRGRLIPSSKKDFRPSGTHDRRPPSGPRSWHPPGVAPANTLPPVTAPAPSISTTSAIPNCPNRRRSSHEHPPNQSAGSCHLSHPPPAGRALASCDRRHPDRCRNSRPGSPLG